MKVLITGCPGRLGNELKKLIHTTYCPSEMKMDITDPLAIKSNFDTYQPDLVIHCAAKTDVSECERQPFDAYYTNSVGTFVLADTCDAYGIKMVYISTDHVFDGVRGNYSELSVPNPKGHYAKSKLAGEYFALANKNNLVIRTSFMKDFKFEKAYTDKFFSGERVEDVAEMIVRAIELDLKGLWHIAGERKSIYDFAKTLRKNVKPMKLKERPKNEMGLRYLRDTSLNIQRWKDELNACECGTNE